jgi:hypothetical protein
MEGVSKGGPRANGERGKLTSEVIGDVGKLIKGVKGIN